MAALLLAGVAGCASVGPMDGDADPSELASSLQAHDQCFAAWQSQLDAWVARNGGFRPGLAANRSAIANDADTTLSAMIRAGWANQGDALEGRVDRDARLEIAGAFDRAIPDAIPELCRSFVWMPVLILNSSGLFMAGARDDLLAQAPPDVREDDARFVNWFFFELLRRP
ncbi:MAG TPA: hypothetical protein VFQ84_12475 [Arenimonas sp.]|uniref:hypothetical protein n=1 Tax=Arenimonas sp. TaxID=1872635 RepID=UPI002D7E3F47|nr:hypothetical protein [Arenimonas sp.]HEU0154148.1 hypothetical protein [Arenimonas sp.]